MNQHFGKLGDVWKHLPLAEILRLNPPRHYWETHSGSAYYPMTETPERVHGAIGFTLRAPEDPDLKSCAYLETLRNNPDIYPGSTMMAVSALGKGADYIFCDIDPESIETLKKATTGVNAEVVDGDGVETIFRQTELVRFSPEDVLVHIDPFDPNERANVTGKTPVELAGYLAMEGYRLVYWYGYDSLAERGWAKPAIEQHAPGVNLWCGDALMPAPFIYPDRQGVWGCGIVLANATAKEIEVCERLGHSLERICRADASPGNTPSCLSFKSWGS